MRQKSVPEKEPATEVVKKIRRATRRHFSAEDKIRIVLEGLRGEDSIAELCRREGITSSMYYGWSKPAEQATTAVFYSISNCQPGLRGVSFGNFLIKQVVEDLSRDLPALKTFVALSPAPGFGPWLKRVADDPATAGLEGVDADTLALLRTPDWHQDPTTRERLRPVLLGLAPFYSLRAKSGGKPLDPLARFHLGNGARLEQLNFLGDTSAKSMREAAGLMVNYLYELRFIEANHEAFANHSTIVASNAVERQLREFGP